MRRAGTKRGLGAIGVAVALAPLVAAAEAPHPCGELGTDAGAVAQASCWLERHTAGAPECKGAAGEAVCLEQTAGWCAQAPLDDARVANMCFLAPLRLGRFEDAAQVVEYLSEPTPEVTKCREALVGVGELRIVTNPAGGEVVLGATSYGVAPVIIRLPSPWWKHELIVAFGETRISVGSAQVRGALDAKSCEMGDLVVQGPAPPPPPPPLPAAPPPTLLAPPPPIAPSADEPAASPVGGWVLAGGGAAVAVAGAVLLGLAESAAQNVQDQANMGQEWSAVADDYDRVEPMRIAGGVLVVAGALGVGTGTILIATSY